MNADWFFNVVHRAGHFVLPEGHLLKVPRALFDSGALGASYISEQFVSDNAKILNPLLDIARGSVKLASSHHVVAITHSILLVTQFADSTGRTHSATLRLYVLPGLNSDIVVGLPAIITSFGPLFIEMIQGALAQKTEASYINNTLAPDLIDPWSTPTLEEAPEDLETPLPCSFSAALHYMEQSYQESVDEYISQIDEHTAPEFRSSTAIVNLLKSQKAIDVFVPSNWEGIRGVEIELTWKDDLPERLKPKARPINPKLFQHAKEEFDRLTKYFYQDSDSPIASCLVIAPKATKPFIRF